MHSRQLNNSILRSTNNLMMLSTSSNSMNKITKRKDDEIKNYPTTKPISSPIKFGKSPPKLYNKYNDRRRILTSQCDPITWSQFEGGKIVYKRQDKENQK